MDIARYYATLGIRIEKKEIAKVDSTLKKLEQKLKLFSKKLDKHLNVKIDLSNFLIDQKKLNTSLGKALDKASDTLVFQISKFDVDRRALQAAMNRAGRGIRGTTGPGAQQLSPTEWDRRALMSSKLRREEGLARQAERLELARMRLSNRAGGMSSRSAVGAGIAGGISARMYGPAIALGMGGYGLSNLNRRNQEVISAQLTTQAVTEAAGLPGQGGEAFDWLRQQGNRIGFNFLGQSQDYNNYLSNALGAGMGLEESQNTYLGFAEYSRAMGISPARNKLVMNALSQMMGKGTVQMEELKRQMAESMPGTMAVFAEAYQNQLQATGKGGGLTGNEALAQLYADVPKGLLKTSELAPYLTEVLRRKAAPKLDVAMQTSQAWQARFQNVTSDMAILASQSGVEAGFKNIFRSLTQGMQESGSLVQALARAFESITNETSKLILFPQSFVRALEGRDSLVADWLGLDATVQLREDWTEIKNLFESITGMETPSFMPSLEATTKEIAGMLRAIGAFSSQYSETRASTQQVMEDVYYGSDLSTPSARTWANIKSTVAGNVHSVSTLFGGEDAVANYWMKREKEAGFNTGMMYGDNPEAWRAQQKDLRKAAAYDVFGAGGAGISPSTAGGFIAEQNNKFEIVIPESVRDVDGMNEYFKTEFKSTLGQVLMETMPSFNNRESH